MPNQTTPTDAAHGSADRDGPSLYMRRGQHHLGNRDPETCMTATIETVDDDRASSLLGVLGPS